MRDSETSGWIGGLPHCPDGGDINRKQRMPQAVSYAKSKTGNICINRPITEGVNIAALAIWGYGSSNRQFYINHATKEAEFAIFL